MRDRWQKISPYAVPALVFSGVVLALFWHIWTPFGTRREFGIDSQWEYWGDLQFQLDALRHGQLPLWNPYDRCGYPFHADPQAGILYPLTWVLLAIGAVIRDTPFWLIDFKNIFHFWLAAVGMYAYLRWRGLPAFAAYAGGILTIICSPWIHHIDLALNWSMAYAPWALLAVEACAARPTVGKGAALALVLGLSFLAGAPPCLWYLLCAVVPMAAWAVTHHARLARRARRLGPYAVRLAAAMAVALVLIVLMCIGQLASTAALLPHTVRTGNGVAFALSTQFNSSDLIGFFVPRVTRLNQYIGAIAVFGAGAAVILRPSPRIFVLVALVVVSVICAFGAEGVLLRLLATAFPPFRYFRYAMRYTYVTLVALPILCAEGLAALAELRREGRAHPARWLILGLALAAAVAMAVATIVAKGDARAAYVMGLIAYATAGFALFGLMSAHRAAIFMVLAPLLLLADNLVVHADAVERSLNPPVDVSRDGKLAELAGVPLEVRIYDRSWLKFRPGLRRHVRDFAGYEDDPLALDRYAALRDIIRAQPRKLGYANVRYLLEEGAKVLARTPDDAAALRPIEKGIYEIREVAPEVAWFAHAELAADQRSALGTLLRRPAGQLAVLEKNTLTADEIARLSQPVAPASQPALPAAVTGELVELEPDHLVAQVDAPADGVVVLSEAYYPGWDATVDGQPARVLPANAMFRAVLVGPGAHTIEMTYTAPLFIPLAIVELAALIAALALVLRDLCAARRPGDPDREPRTAPAAVL